MDRATVQLSNLQTQKVTTQINIDNGYLGLKFLIGVPYNDSLVLTDKITEEKIREACRLKITTSIQTEKNTNFLLLLIN